MAFPAPREEGRRRSEAGELAAGEHEAGRPEASELAAGEPEAGRPEPLRAAATAAVGAQGRRADDALRRAPHRRPGRQEAGFAGGGRARAGPVRAPPSWIRRPWTRRSRPAPPSPSPAREMPRGERGCIFTHPLSSEANCLRLLHRLLDGDFAMHSANSRGKNGIASPVGLSLRQFRMPKYWIRHAGAEAPAVSCCVMGD